MIVSRAARASATKDDSGQARLLKAAVLASTSELALLRSVGPAPNDLGTVRVQDTGLPVARIRSGLELQRTWTFR
jgi:hypothetical protein